MELTDYQMDVLKTHCQDAWCLPDRHQLFLYWIVERENIRVAKEDLLQDKPWSGDPTFQNTYFCNVRREDDRVTKHIRYAVKDVSPRDLPWMFTIMRLMNKVESVDCIMSRYNTHPSINELPIMIGDLKRRRNVNGEVIFGNAYMVYPGREKDKMDHVQNVTEAVAKLDLTCYTSLSFVHMKLQKVFGLSSFMAAQIVADLKNSPQHNLKLADDWYSFVAAGPGSLRGLGWLLGDKQTEKSFMGNFKTAVDLIDDHICPDMFEILCGQDIQNCLCEYDKYMRVFTNSGKSKRKYNGVN